jgi:phenylalanyl-tRNA synthetase beta chain
MPTITLKKSVLEKLIGKKLALEELKDRISMLGTDLEKIEGNEIVVEVFPNRPDMLSEAGFARALASFIGTKTGLIEYDVKRAAASKNYKVIIDESVKDVRPFTACAVIRNLRLDEDKIREIIQLQEKLHVTYGRNRKKLAIGIYPLEKINLPIHYKALAPDKIRFRPLEESVEMSGREILNHTSAGRDYGFLLKDKVKFPVFTDAKGKVLSMPPIINSHETGKVSDKTRDIFVECSGFDQIALNKCLNIIVVSLSDLGGDIYAMSIEQAGTQTLSPQLAPVEWKVNLSYINKMLGIELKSADVKKLLERMGMTLKADSVLVPCYRSDILHEIDIAEDVAIAYGYENFTPLIPNVMTIGEEDGLEVFKNRVASVLAGLGLTEISSYILTNTDINNRKAFNDNKTVELENSKTIDRNILRGWMIPSLLQVLSENTSNEYPQEIFEFNTCFSIDSSYETGIKESQMLAVALARADSDFTKAKQVLEELSISLSLKFYLEKNGLKTFIPGRRASILFGKAEVGFLGEVNPAVLENFSIQMPTAALELDIGKIYELAKVKSDSDG